jgi:2-polyprenyl-3-methyl-5-hydroxy-6-metoxy-1,4-benzoquinol methylase
MAGCCSTCSSSQQATDNFFTRHASKYARRYSRKGPDRVQRRILNGLDPSMYTNRHILDIGCGTGNMHFELLRRGAARATGVDIADGMIEQAKSLSEKYGFAENTIYLQGDIVDRKDDIENADLTILDKVVCCYDDIKSLIMTALIKTSSAIVISHPRNTLVLRFGFIVQDFLSRLFRMKFRPFWHEWNSIHETIKANGYSVMYEDTTFLWHIVIFRKSASGAT